MEHQKCLPFRKSLGRWLCILGLGLAGGPLVAATNPACPTCVLDYPYPSTNPRTSLIFNESEILRAFSTNVLGRGDTIRAFYNDEHALVLGVRQVIVITSKGITTNFYPVSPLSSNPAAVRYPSVGSTISTGDQAGTDLAERPMFPALFITDITTNLTSKAGDWQFGGTPILPHAVFGTWKAAIRKVDLTRSTPVVSVEPDVDPAKNHWNLAGGDPVPAGAADEGYGAEIRWNVDELGLAHGHVYRLYFMMHDGDQNKTGGDVGHACLNVIVEDRSPVAGPDAYTVLEDSVLSVSAPGVLANDFDIDHDSLTAILVVGPAHGSLSLSANGGFVYTPARDFNGIDSFTYKAHSGNLDSTNLNVKITVNPVNDPPSFTKGPNQMMNEEAPSQRIAGWATNISPGPPDESNQTLSFTLMNDNPGLFSTQPALSPAGMLTYTPAPHAYGIAHMIAILKDNGGTANGGIDTSVPQSFTIGVNSPPTVNILEPLDGTIFIAPADITIIADAHDPDGAVSQVRILQANTLLYQTNASPAITTWNRVPAGNYQFTAQATDNLGATGVSDPVNVTVLPNPPLTVIQAPRFNPQSGLFEAIVRLSNPTPFTLNSVRVLIRNLQTNMQVFNATGTTNGVPFVQTRLPIAAGSSMDLTIEFYVNNYQTPNPALTAELADPVLRAVSDDLTNIPKTRELRMVNGDFLIEFSSLSNRLYFLQYSGDLKSWSTAWPGVSGTGNRIQWIDNGPPRTESRPAAQTTRFYRIMMAP